MSPPVPGLPIAVSAALSVLYDATDDNVDVFADVGSPATPVNVFVVVSAGVVIGSTDPDVPAMTMDGFHDDSIVTLLVNGRIGGAGTDGGDGSAGFISFGGSPSNFRGGGGGGGAGTTPGAGGIAVAGGTASDGTAGTSADSNAGGAGGGNDPFTGVIDPDEAAIPAQGGIALQGASTGSWTLRIDNGSGEIWGGGSGGRGGYRDEFGDHDPVNGGDWGDGSDEAPLEGGAAVNHAGTLTFLSGGTAPNVKGRLDP